MRANRLRVAGRHARTTSTLRTVLASLSAATDASRAADVVEGVRTILRRSWRASATETGTKAGVAVTDRLRRGSQSVAVATRLAGPLAISTQQAVDRATVTGLARWFEGAVRASWLYRWLTAEPEPEVIVIDLRETVSVGPVIALLDRSLRVLLPASHRSTIVGAAESVHQSVAAAPVRAASLVLGAAVLTDLAVTLAIGEPSQAGVVARVVLLGLAALGTRVSMTWDELVESRAIRLLVAALEPPEPPDDGT